MADLVLNVAIEKPGFSLQVKESVPLDEITAVFGPSGSGKTTLLRIIAGLEPASRGTVVFDEKVWQDEHGSVPAHERAVGYVFQDARLFPHLTVERNLAFALRHSRSRAAIGMSEVISALDLTPLLARRPASLSGGEQQRVAIGRALLTSPRVLLMDEPLSSLDTARKREIISYIEELPGRFAIPVLYVTHDIDEVTRLSSRMLLLSAGRMAAHGDVSEILQRIDLWSSTGRLEAGSVIEARIERHAEGMTHLAFETGRLQIPAIDAVPGKRIRLRIHARDVAVATERPRHLSIRNVLPATIETIDLDATVHVELLLSVGAQTLRARITRSALEDLGLAEGQFVHALIKSVLFEGRL